MSPMRPQWIIGLVGLVVLTVPIALAFAVKGRHHAKTPASAPAIVLARQDGNDALTLAVDASSVRVTLYDQQGNVAVGTTPLLMLDMWEHAFYLDYVNVKADYVKAFWNIVNWDEINNRYNAFKSGKAVHEAELAHR